MSIEAPAPLARFQKYFAKEITQPEGLATGLQHIIAGGTLSREQALTVYRDDYRFRLCQALGDKYESVWLLLGDQQFQELAFEYIKACPSVYRDLTNYGKDFPEFLKRFYREADCAFIAGMACFEREFWDLFHLQKTDVQSGNELLASFSAPEDLWEHHWRFTPNMNFVSSKWDLWSVFIRRKKTSDELKTVELERAIQGVIFKEDIQVEYKELTPSQFELLKELQAGATLKSFMQSDKKISEADVQSLFAFFSQHKIILK